MTLGLLFSYGSLQNKAVQAATFGRELVCHEDTLPGYVHRWTVAADPEITAMTGVPRYATVEPSSNPSDAVSGLALEITEQDLTAADKYEEDMHYRRIAVKLGSGSQAWVYVRF